MTTATRRLGLARDVQYDFSAGAYPGLEVIPPNGAEDIVNGVIADDGSVFRRGAGVDKQTNTGADLLRALWDGELLGGPQTVAFTQNNIQHLISDTTLGNIGGGAVFDRAVRPVALGRTLVAPLGSDASATNHFVMVYAGSVAHANSLAPAGSITLTQGSTAVTGSGTAFTSDLWPGAILVRSAGDFRFSTVESVQSNTAATLAEAFPYATLTGASGWQAYPALIIAINRLKSDQRSYVAQVARRLVIGQGDTVIFSQFLEDSKGLTYSAPLLFGISEADPDTVENRHKLPEGARLTGLAALRDTMMVFTSAGVWAISGMALELTDALGNPQQRMDQVNRDVILWANGGIVTYRNSLIVPALDDLYLMDTVSSPQPITGGARKLYRSYTRQGYLLGQAAVHRGHYFLPILDPGENMVDTLVWRLDAPGTPFTRWDGYGGLSRAFLARSRSGLSPQLLSSAGGLGRPRIVELTDALDVGASGSGTDSDGSSFDLKVTTRTFQAPGLIAQMWRRFRARFEAQSSPSASLEYATGKPGSSFTSVPTSQVLSTDNEQVWSWSLSKRARAIRFRLTIHSGSTREVLRSLEVFSRPGGRR